MVDRRTALRVSGTLEIVLGIGHSIVGTVLFTAPQALVPLLGLIPAPAEVLTPITVPALRYLMEGVFLIAGWDWIVFGSILLWLARVPARPGDRVLLGLVLAQQVGFLLLMLVFLRFHWPAIVQIVAMIAALAAARRSAT